MNTVLYCCPNFSECTASQTIPFQAIHGQQKKLLTYCEEHQLSVDAIYTDVTPPFSIYNRPAFANLIRDGQNGQYKKLLCLSLDTLCCNHLVQSAVVQLLESRHIHLILI